MGNSNLQNMSFSGSDWTDEDTKTEIDANSSISFRKNTGNSELRSRKRDVVSLKNQEEGKSTIDKESKTELIQGPPPIKFVNSAFNEDSDDDGDQYNAFDNEPVVYAGPMKVKQTDQKSLST